MRRQLSVGCAAGEVHGSVAAVPARLGSDDEEGVHDPGDAVPVQRV